MTKFKKLCNPIIILLLACLIQLSLVSICLAINTLRDHIGAGAQNKEGALDPTLPQMKEVMKRLSGSKAITESDLKEIIESVENDPDSIEFKGFGPSKEIALKVCESSVAKDYGYGVGVVRVTRNPEGKIVEVELTKSEDSEALMVADDSGRVVFNLKGASLQMLYNKFKESNNSCSFVNTEADAKILAERLGSYLRDKYTDPGTREKAAEILLSMGNSNIEGKSYLEQEAIGEFHSIIEAGNNLDISYAKEAIVTLNNLALGGNGPLSSMAEKELEDIVNRDDVGSGSLLYAYADKDISASHEKLTTSLSKKLDKAQLSEIEPIFRENNFNRIKDPEIAGSLAKRLSVLSKLDSTNERKVLAANMLLFMANANIEDKTYIAESAIKELPNIVHNEYNERYLIKTNALKLLNETAVGFNSKKASLKDAAANSLKALIDRNKEDDIIQSSIFLNVYMGAFEAFGVFGLEESPVHSVLAEALSENFNNIPIEQIHPKFYVTEENRYDFQNLKDLNVVEALIGRLEDISENENNPKAEDMLAALKESKDIFKLNGLKMPVLLWEALIKLNGIELIDGCKYKLDVEKINRVPFKGNFAENNTKEFLDEVGRLAFGKIPVIIATSEEQANRLKENRLIIEAGLDQSILLLRNEAEFEQWASLVGEGNMLDLGQMTEASDILERKEFFGALATTS